MGAKFLRVGVHPFSTWHDSCIEDWWHDSCSKVDGMILALRGGARSDLDGVQYPLAKFGKSVSKCENFSHLATLARSVPFARCCNLWNHNHLQGG